MFTCINKKEMNTYINIYIVVIGLSGVQFGL